MSSYSMQLANAATAQQEMTAIFGKTDGTLPSEWLYKTRPLQYVVMTDKCHLKSIKPRVKMLTYS